MAEKSFPLENTLYTAQDAQLWFATRTSGVYTNGHLGVTASGTMNLSLGAGIAWLHYDTYAGCVYGNTSSKALTVTMSDAQYNRIDRVCIRLEMLSNKCYAYIKKGTAAASPAAPALQRDNVAYEISVARVHVGVGVTKIDASNITDERLDTSVCGLMRDGVTGIDTSVMQANFTATMNKYSTYLDSFLDEKEAAFNAWMQGLQNVLDGDTAGNLLNKINTKAAAKGATVALDTSGWTQSGELVTKTVSVAGVKATDLLTVAPEPGSFDAYAQAGIRATAQAAGSVTFAAAATPESAVNVNIMMVTPGV